MGQNWLVQEIIAGSTPPATDITKITDALDSLKTKFSGASLPTANLVGGMEALDTTNKLYWKRDSANTKWMIDRSAADVMTLTKSTAYTLALGDFGKMVVCTGSGGWALTFPSAATLTDSWWCMVRNDSTGTITPTPDGVETIDISAIAPGQSGVVWSDGANLKTIGFATTATSATKLVNGASDVLTSDGSKNTSALPMVMPDATAVDEAVNLGQADARYAEFGGMYLTADSLPAASTFTKLSCTTFECSSGIVFNAVGSPVSSLTVQSGGMYEISLQGSFNDADSAGSVGQLRVYKNGVSLSNTWATTVFRQPGIAGNSVENAKVFPVRLAAGDYLELYDYANSANCTFYASSTNMFIKKIGA